MDINGSEPRCPLCGSDGIDPFYEDTARVYLRCMYCRLVFVPKNYWLSPEDEIAIYDLHENNAQDQGYRQFLSRLCTPLLEKLDSNQKGLDFGCGPGPTLSAMLEKQGHQVDLYDLYFYKDISVFQNRYDFICTTEVVDHLHDPDQEFSAMFKMLKPGGWLGIMTKLVIDEHVFRNWHYIRDMTHILFFSRTTFDYLGQRFDAEVNFVASDVKLLNKN